MLRLYNHDKNKELKFSDSRPACDDQRGLMAFTQPASVFNSLIILGNSQIRYNDLARKHYNKQILYLLKDLSVSMTHRFSAVCPLKWQALMMMMIPLAQF